MISWLEAHLLPCLFMKMTGIPCPGCGMQRAFISLLRGDLAHSLLLYPPLLPMLATVVLLAIHLRVGLRNGARYVMLGGIASSALMIVNYIVRIALSQ